MGAKEEKTQRTQLLTTENLSPIHQNIYSFFLADGDIVIRLKDNSLRHCALLKTFQHMCNKLGILIVLISQDWSTDIFSFTTHYLSLSASSVLGHLSLSPCQLHVEHTLLLLQYFLHITTIFVQQTSQLAFLPHETLISLYFVVFIVCYC